MKYCNMSTYVFCVLFAIIFTVMGQTENSDFQTPRKSSTVCCVCGEKPREKRNVAGKNRSGKNVSELLLKYGELNVLEGVMCRMCYEKLLKIDQLIIDFRHKCKTSKHGIKRCLNTSPLKDVTNNISFLSPMMSDSGIFMSPILMNNSISTSIPILPMTPVPSPSIDSVVKSECFAKPKQVKRSLLNDSGFTDNSTEHSYSKPLKNDVKAQKTSTPLVKQSLKTCPKAKPVLSQSEKNNILHLLNSGGYVSHIADVLLKNQHFVDYSIQHHAKESSDTLKSMNNHKHGFISQLMKKSYSDMSAFSWDNICEEFKDKLPVLSKMIELTLNIHQKKVVPRIGMVYAILAQTHHQKLSLVQRMTSLCLLDNIADQKIYDRLHPLGLCMSYEQSHNLLQEIGQTYTNQMSAAMKEGKRLCLVGDNVNYAVGIREQRKENCGKTKLLHHAFASVALLNDSKFDHLSKIKPQRPWTDLKLDDFIVNEEEYKNIRLDYTKHIVKAAIKHVPFFKILDDVFDESSKINEEQYRKTLVIPLETVLKNEQYYADVVDIMEQHENIIEKTFQDAGVTLTDKTKIHTGGDQLTRERYSGAKVLRAAEANVKHRFGHLGPITFEMFHLVMNFLQVFFDLLYKDKSAGDIGTLKCEINRIMRTQVNSDVKNAYDADKDFALSFIEAYIVELVTEFFGLDDHLSQPTKNIPPEFTTKEEKKQWTVDTFGKMVDEFVWPKHKPKNPVVDKSVVVDGQFMNLKVRLANGKEVQISPRLPEKNKETPPETDKVMNYGQMVLELGLLFKELLDVCKSPDQKKLLRLLKHSMTVFKAKSNNSKYAFEIHRFLIQQISTLSEKEAAEVVQGMFVNTTGKPDGHIPADLQMEYVVKTIKKHIKHMYSNKSEQNIANHTKALSGVRDIAEHFDSISGVIVRSKKHKHKDAAGDELMMIGDLRKLRPFKFEAGRYHSAFPDINKSAVDNLPRTDYHTWITTRIVTNANDLGD